jgi:hypothetical protein
MAASADPNRRLRKGSNGETVPRHAHRTNAFRRVAYHAAHSERKKPAAAPFLTALLS